MSSTATAPAFRPDIEGLRAIAVLLVVATHAGVPGFAGGYVGVDVFFVISGFLITRLLHAEWRASGRIDLAGFYARRLRRLFPASLLMIAVTALVIWLVYSPLEQPAFLDSAMAATLYYSNVHYALEATNYMAASAKLDPFLHTWSLGVEEQFYLAWPLLLLAAGALARRRNGGDGGDGVLAGLLALVVAASLAATLWLTGSRQPDAFFLPFTRAWEFGLGALVALQGWRLAGPGGPLAAPRTARLVALAGLLLLAVANLLFNDKTPFPGWRALLPALGTGLMLLAVPAAPGGAVARLLALAPLQWLGRVSYGWYLWHWPLLVIGLGMLPGAGLPLTLPLALVALLLAQLSYRTVENPLRHSPALQSPLRVYAIAATLAVATASALVMTRDLASDISGSPRYESLQAARVDMPPIYAEGNDCDSWYYNDTLVECYGGDPRGRQVAVLVGDSHAAQWFTPFHELLLARGWKLIVMTKSACPLVAREFFYDPLGRNYTECTRWKQHVVKRLRELHPALVIVSNSEGYEFTPREWMEGVRDQLAPMADASGRLVILRDSPDPGFNIPVCLARQEWSPRLHAGACTFDPAKRASPAVLAAYHALAASRHNVALLDATPLICPQSPCTAASGSTLKYRDAGHLANSFVRGLRPPLDDWLARIGTF